MGIDSAAERIGGFGDPTVRPLQDERTFDFCLLRPLRNAHPAKVTLVWTDLPGDPGCAIVLVNDLDLVVVNQETHKSYLGNARLTSLIRPGDADHMHTIEQVILDAKEHYGAQPQSYTVHVKGHNVIIEQPFSLVVTGAVKLGHCTPEDVATQAAQLAANKVELVMPVDGPELNLLDTH